MSGIKAPMAYSCRVLADSISPNNVRLTTLECTYPRMVHSELLTHRMFTRNSASSRAIPVDREPTEGAGAGMIQRVLADPVEPVWWGKNQSGMQAREELTGEDLDFAKLDWHDAKKAMVARARSLNSRNAHKQIVNRLLEPWMWITVIVSSTEWSNWDALRCHPDAQPELRRIAEMMRDARAASEPRSVNYDDWHTPLVEPDEEFDLQVEKEGELLLVSTKRVSVGRCARVSFLTHDGKRDPRADDRLAKKLQGDGHMSPLEHAARPMFEWEHAIYKRFEVRDEGAPLQPWELDVFENRGRYYNTFPVHDLQAQSCYPEQRIIDCGSWCGNFRGWVQYRKTVPGESDFGLLQRARQ